MSKNLIDRTNSDKFYQNCNLYLESKQLFTTQNKMELIISINQADYDIPIEYEEWKIVCCNLISSRSLDNKFLMPYVKIAILKEHPLLWQFHECINECYIKGIPENLKEFYGEFTIILEEKTGNWIQLTDKMWNLKHFFKRDKERYIPLSDSMKEVVENLCNRYNIDFRVKKKITDNSKPNSQLLIFGNSQVSPHKFNLKQPYIIADSFQFTRLK